MLLATGPGAQAAPLAGEVAAGNARNAALYGGGEGRFDIVAYAGEAGRRLAVLGDDAWAGWRDPLGLPERWPSGITVRLVPELEWKLGESAWRVVSEPGGVVTVWLKSGPAGLARDRRWLLALAEGALHRQAIGLAVVPERIWIPDWLVAGAAEAVLSSGERASLQDSWRRSAGQAGRMPSLIAVLTWQGGVQTATETGDARTVAAFGVWQWLRAESRGTLAWRLFLAGLLRGQAPRPALNAAYGARFTGMAGQELELAWQTAAAGLARVQVLPVFSAAESRVWLDYMDRLVVLDANDGREHAVRLSEVWAERREPALRVTRERRAAGLAAEFARAHPFYRNAAGSLGRVWLAQGTGRETAWREALAEWRADRAAGEELERTSAALLDGTVR
ncbi:MAG: hypothetical protein NTU80_10290 [Verrucomicrobia bacterium]|nr:hypothetical protein [Verrucomicrobiota bacterium]